MLTFIALNLKKIANWIWRAGNGLVRGHDQFLTPESPLLKVCSKMHKSYGMRPFRNSCVYKLTGLLQAIRFF